VRGKERRLELDVLEAEGPPQGPNRKPKLGRSGGETAGLVGAGFDLERIGLRAVRGSPLLCETWQFCKKLLDVENQGVTVCETYL
jgi:hypothetical protein